MSSSTVRASAPVRLHLVGVSEIVVAGIIRRRNVIVKSVARHDLKGHRRRLAVRRLTVHRRNLRGTVPTADEITEGRHLAGERSVGGPRRSHPGERRERQHTDRSKKYAHAPNLSLMKRRTRHSVFWRTRGSPWALPEEARTAGDANTITLTYVDVEREDAAIVLTMQRPERRNALSLDMMRELDGALAAAGEDPRARAVILRGDGPAFSAGHDLRELVDRDVEAYRAIFDACVALMERISAIPQPVIAEVAGIATAAGCQLVAACDLAVASTQATFATPGVRIGLFCSTPMVALTRAIGRKRAMEMLLTGEPIDAATAQEWGLVNRVVPLERLHAEASALAARVASSSRTVVGIGKAAFYAQVDLDATAAYAYAKEVMTMNALAADAREGIGAFLEKRAPVWQH